MALLLLWIVYALVGVSVFSAVFIWAVRAGQFRDQDRARYLPLEAPPREEE
jgi:cbb3-type cytochrome oxidase maturation protein